MKGRWKKRVVVVVVLLYNVSSDEYNEADNFRQAKAKRGKCHRRKGGDPGPLFLIVLVFVLSLVRVRLFSGWASPAYY